MKKVVMNTPQEKASFNEMVNTLAVMARSKP